MRTRKMMGLALLGGTLALLMGETEPARSQQKPPAKAQPAVDFAQPQAPKAPAKSSLEGRIMAYSKLKQPETSKFLEALGPVVRDMLTAGQDVSVPGLGTFRIVAVPAHRDMVQGRPVTVPAANHVEFIPTGELAGAANANDATPAEVVTPFQYTPIPDRVPGTKAPNTRMPNVRTR